MVQSPNLHFPLIPHIIALTLVHSSDVLGLLLSNRHTLQLHQLLDTSLPVCPDVNQVLAFTGVPIVCTIKKKYFHLVSFKGFNTQKNILDFLIHCLFKLLFSEESELFFKTFRHNRHHFSLFTCIKEWKSKGAVSQTICQESFLEYPIYDCGSLLEKNLTR